MKLRAYGSEGGSIRSLRRMLADASWDQGKPVEHVVLAGDDHYLLKSATRTQMLQTLEAFPAKNLPVTPRAAP